jgi:hypothetical protein
MLLTSFGACIDSVPDCDETVTPRPGCTVEDVCGVDESCLQVDSVDGTCPTASDAGVSAVCEEGLLDEPAVGGSAAGGGGAENTIVCCYAVEQLALGRPFLVDGRPTVASHRVTGSSAAARRAIGQAWVEDALMEHASVAAFARFAMELMALSAPLDLVESAHAAMGDELAHTRICVEMAERHGVTVSFGALPGGSIQLSDVDLTDVVVRAVVEGCVGETIAAMIATEAAATAQDQGARLALRRIAQDEARHAELAWRFVRWAVCRSPELASVVEQAFDAAAVGQGASASSTCEHEAAMREAGRLSARVRAGIARRTLREVIAPCRAALAELAG